MILDAKKNIYGTREQHNPGKFPEIFRKIQDVNFQAQENSLASSDSSTGNLSSIPKTEVDLKCAFFPTDWLKSEVFFFKTDF